MTEITPVVFCGGSGTRLWPLSRKSFPKQFVPLIGNKSLLQLTLERVSLISKNVICVASDEHRFLVAEAMQASKVQGTVLLEPVARNTAAAMAIAALAAKPEDLLLFCPSDHHIPDAAAFALVVKQGVAAAQACAIVTFGISPTFPSTAYGYIRQGGNRPNGAFNVDGFQKNQPKTRLRPCCSQAARFGMPAALCARNHKRLKPAAQKASTTQSWSTTPTWLCSPLPAPGATSVVSCGRPDPS